MVGSMQIDTKPDGVDQSPHWTLNAKMVSDIIAHGISIAQVVRIALAWP